MSDADPPEDSEDGSSRDPDAPKPLDITKLAPKHQVSTRLGTLIIRRINFADQRLLQKAEDQQQLDALAFTRLLIERTVTRGEGEDRLSDEEVDCLAADPCFLEELITGHPELTRVAHDAAGNAGALTTEGEQPAHLMREESESAEDYLLRAWRTYNENVKSKLKKLSDAMTTRFGGLAGVLSSSGLASLADSLKASNALQDMIDQGAAYSRWESEFSPKIEAPYIPPNPIEKTNEHLEDLVTSIDQMREVTVKTAEMQRALNSVATEILDKFVTGTASAERAAAKNLLIAKFGLGIAIVSVVVTLAVSITQLAMSGPTEWEVAHMRRMEAFARSDLHQSTRQQQALRDLARLEMLQIEKSAAAQKAAGARAGN